MAIIRHLGHAGFIVEHNGTRILIDPWFYPAFLHSWFPYPDNRSCLQLITGQHFDALYISHLHQDHFDEHLLRTLDKSIKVIAPKYRSRELLRRMKGLGFETIVPLDHKQSLTLAPGLEATMFLDTSYKEDSGLLLALDGFRLLDLNDCNTTLSELPGRVDMLAAQYSGAMWYPNCYDYPTPIVQKKVDTVRSQLMETLYGKVRATGCKWYLPSAGPACFLDPALAQFNDRHATIFPLWEDVEAAFNRALPDITVLQIHPGDELTYDAGRVSVRATVPHSRENLDNYRERRRDEWAAFYDGEEPSITEDELDRYFARLQRINPHLVTDFQKTMRLSSGSGKWKVQLGKLAQDFVIESEEPLDPEYAIELSPRILKEILLGTVGWEEALLSMRLHLHRDPDVFDSKLMGLLRYGNHPVQTLQLVREQNCTETIERDGLRLQRFCPHAGEDLTFAYIYDGIIECPRHHWKWDITTGRCIDGGTLPLRVEAAAPSTERRKDERGDAA